MTEAQKNSAYYAVITAPVRYDPGLSSTAKLLYGEITSLCRAKGYCWATNSHFAGLYGVSESTISRLISQLEKRGHIRVETVAIATGSERRIYTDVNYVGAAPEGGTQKEQPPSGGCAKRAKGGTQKDQGGVRKNRKQNDYQGNDLSEDIPPNPPEGDGAPAEPGLVDKPEPKPKRKRRAQRSIPIHAPERFEQFWEVYPVGGSRLKAVEAWDALAPDDALIDEMARALRRQMASRMWKEGIGIPHACRWIRDQRWTDKLPEEYRPPASSGSWADFPGVGK